MVKKLKKKRQSDAPTPPVAESPPVKKLKKKKKRLLASDGADGAQVTKLPAVTEAPETPPRKLKKKKRKVSSEPDVAPVKSEVVSSTVSAAAEQPVKKKKKRKHAAVEVPSAAPEVRSEETTARKKKKKRLNSAAVDATPDVTTKSNPAAASTGPTKNGATGSEKKPAAAPGMKIFVAGIPFTTQEEDLRADFEECGEIESLVCLKDDQGQFKGVAFITYKTKAAVDAALAYHNTDYGGRSLIVQLAKDNPSAKERENDTSKSSGSYSSFPAGDKNNRKVFVGGVPFAVTEADLRSDFEECGEMDDFVCLKDETGRFKGMAFVTYKTQAGVDAALAYDGTEYGGRFLKVSMATPRGSSSKCSGKEGSSDKGSKGKDKGKGKGKDKGKKGKDKGKGKGKDKGKGKGKGKDKGRNNPKKFGFELGSDDE